MVSWVDEIRTGSGSDRAKRLLIPDCGLLIGLFHCLPIGFGNRKSAIVWPGRYRSRFRLRLTQTELSYAKPMLSLSRFRLLRKVVELARRLQRAQHPIGTPGTIRREFVGRPGVV